MRLVLLKVSKSQKVFFFKGPFIKDVSPKGEGGGYKKCPKRRRSLVDLRRQGEGGYPKNLKFGETSLMDGPLALTDDCMIDVLTFIK